MIELVLALQLATQCAPNVAPATMAAIVRVESSNNPYAIGVVGGALPRQPRSKAEALNAVAELERQGKNFSMGLAQINRHNLPRYGITYAEVFEPCTNLRVGGEILADCYRRAMPSHPGPQAALRAALSCYYSGNFVRGFRPDRPGDPSYVEKVVAAAGQGTPQLVVPAIQATPAARRPERSVLVPLESEAVAQEAQPSMDAHQDDDGQPIRLRVINETPDQVQPVRRVESNAVVF